VYHTTLVSRLLPVISDMPSVSRAEAPCRTCSPGRRNSVTRRRGSGDGVMADDGKG